MPTEEGVDTEVLDEGVGDDPVGGPYKSGVGLGEVKSVSATLRQGRQWPPTLARTMVDPGIALPEGDGTLVAAAGSPWFLRGR